ncbi:hypothetical protein V1514DRAFT_14690 [Lipomyces japonicus]|uniref:uncharacterized protein n=1 Tax=Lipomyces japonicus TaxID=56871 RepID=UPI0034D02153
MTEPLSKVGNNLEQLEQIFQDRQDLQSTNADAAQLLTFNKSQHAQDVFSISNNNVSSNVGDDDDDAVDISNDSISHTFKQHVSTIKRKRGRPSKNLITEPQPALEIPPQPPSESSQGLIENVSSRQSTPTMKRRRGRPPKDPTAGPRPRPPSKPKPARSLELESESEPERQLSEQHEVEEPLQVSESGRPIRKAARASIDYSVLLQTSVDDDEFHADNHKEILTPAKRGRGRPRKDGTVAPRPPSKRRIRQDDDDDDFVVTNNGDDGHGTEEDYDVEDQVNDDFANDNDFSDDGIKKRKPNTKVKRLVQSTTAIRQMEIHFGSRPDVILDASKRRDNWVNSLVTLFEARLDDAINIKQIAGIPFKGQVSVPLDDLAAKPHLPSESTVIRLDIGPKDNIKSVDLFPLQSHRLEPLTEGNRNGILLHCGKYITGAEWAPKSIGQYQYLAISTVIDNSEFEIPLMEQRGTPSSISIWRINLHDNNDLPKLILCILHEWGTAWNVSWAPVEVTNNDSVLGYLSASFQDGIVRVVEIPVNHGNDVEYIRIDKPARMISLPKMLITCHTWTGATRVAVGCSNGFIAIFDLDLANDDEGGSVDDGDDNVERPVPSITYPLHRSTILSITHVGAGNEWTVVTTAVDGNTKIIDTRDVTTCLSQSSRNKGFASVAKYSRHVNSIIMPDDLSSTKILPIRGMTHEIMFSKHEASIMTIATTDCHPFTLVGSSDGVVMIGNVAARALINRREIYKNWVQTQLMKLEYSSSQNRFRFVEGYVSSATVQRGATPSFTVQPKPVCVSSLAWNPQKKTAGWLAAGFANGLLRIENFLVS